MIRKWAAWMSLVVGLFGATAAGAQPSGGMPQAALVHLTYLREARAAECLSPEGLVSAVEARLGRRVFVPAARADVFAEVRAAHERARFVVTVSLFDAARRPLGERRLETRARHCSALDDSLALVLSLAADLRRESDPAAGGAGPLEGQSGSVATRTMLETPLSIPEATLASRLGFAFRPGVGVALGVGLLPAPAVGARARLEILPPRFWPLLLDLTLWHAQRLGAERGVRFSVQSLGVGICPYAPSFERLEVLVCVNESLGKVKATGFGFDETSASDRWTAALGASVLGRYTLGRLYLSLGGALLVPLVQRRYFYSDGDEVTLYRDPWLQGVIEGALGVEL